MQQALLILYVFSAIAIIGLVLIQHGKGADAGAAFGGGGGAGASGSVFGSKGSGSFLTKLTAGFAIIFFSLSLFLAYQAKTQVKGNVDASGSVVNSVTEETIPAVGQELKKEIEAATGIPEVTESTK